MSVDFVFVSLYFCTKFIRKIFVSQHLDKPSQQRLRYLVRQATLRRTHHSLVSHRHRASVQQNRPALDLVAAKRHHYLVRLLVHQWVSARLEQVHLVAHQHRHSDNRNPLLDLTVAQSQNINLMRVLTLWWKMARRLAWARVSIASPQWRSTRPSRWRKFAWKITWPIAKDHKLERLPQAVDFSVQLHPRLVCSVLQLRSPNRPDSLANRQQPTPWVALVRMQTHRSVNSQLLAKLNRQHRTVSLANQIQDSVNLHRHSGNHRPQRQIIYLENHLQQWQHQQTQDSPDLVRYWFEWTIFEGELIWI